MARPPHSEPTSTPSWRAAASTEVPSGKRPRLPEGVKTIRASLLTVILPYPPTARLSATAHAALAPPARGTFGPGRARGRHFAVLANPVRAMRVMAHHHIGSQAGLHDLGVQRIGDRRSEPGTDRHGQERGVDAVAIGQAETDVGGPAGGLDLQLGTEPLQQLHDLAARQVNGADRHYQRV